MTFCLRPIQLPDDYKRIARLLNHIEPANATAEAIQEADKQFPAQWHLKKDDNGKLAGYSRERIVAECTASGEVIGYASVWRAAWAEPGCLASVFFVHPAYRRQGIGSALLHSLESWGKEHHADVLMSELKDWILPSLDFASKHGFSVDAHVYELHLNLLTVQENDFLGPKPSELSFFTLADLPGEASERKLYDLYRETLTDNPGHVGDLPGFEKWKLEAFPKNVSSPELVFIAADGDRFVGVTTLFHTDDPGVKYTDYTGVHRDYRGRGIALSLKWRSIQAALALRAHTLSTETEAGNGPMQAVNHKLGYVQGKGHYRIIKRLERTDDAVTADLQR